MTVVDRQNADFSFIKVMFLLSTLLMGASCQRGAEQATVSIFAAASMGPTLKLLEEGFEKLHPQVEVQFELSGSRLACAKVSDQNRLADVVISADFDLIPEMLQPLHADFTTLFANNALVLAYDPNKAIAERLKNEPWQRVLVQEDVVIGYANPALAPVGYRALLALQLNDLVAPPELRLGRQITQRLQARFQRPDVAKLLAPLQAGEFDVAFVYRTEAEQHHLSSVVLDPRIDFSNPEYAKLYRSVSVKLPGLNATPAKTVRGAPLVYGLTVPRNAPARAWAERFVRFMLSDEGRRLATQAHMRFFSCGRDPKPRESRSSSGRTGPSLNKLMALRILLGLPALSLAILITLPLIALLLGSSIEDITGALSDAEVLSAIGVSLGCAALSVLLGLLIGVPAAYLLARQRLPGTRLWQALLDLPVVIPHPIVGIGLLLIFGRRQLVGSALDSMFGLRVASAAPGIVLAMMVVSSPFIVRAAREAFSAIPESVEKTARSLGASETRVFFTIALPQALPGIRSGSVMAWARAISEFGSIVILAYYPRTAPVLIWDRFSAYGLRSAIAPSIALLLVCLAVFLLFQVLNTGKPVGRRQ